MVLSIGMIVKNEEKYLDRCLSALKPILENVESELIIADTGSEDNTVEIAKKYCGDDDPSFVNGVLGSIVRGKDGN